MRTQCLSQPLGAPKIIYRFISECQQQASMRSVNAVRHFKTCSTYQHKPSRTAARASLYSSDDGNSNESSKYHDSSQPDGPSSSRSSNQPPDASWSLMGRVVSSDRLLIGEGGRSRLVLLAAARQAGVPPEQMAQRLQELVNLMPDLSSLLLVLQPSTLAALAADTAAVAQKLIQLRLLFPTADVSQMISRRPTLLLDEEFTQVEVARAKLVARLTRLPDQPPQHQWHKQASPAAGSQPSHNTSNSSSGSSLFAADGGASLSQPSNLNVLGTTGVTPASTSSSSSGSSNSVPGAAVAALDGLVSRQPLLLVENVDELLDELERLLPGIDVSGALVHNPDLVLNLMSNRNLSLW